MKIKILILGFIYLFLCGCVDDGIEYDQAKEKIKLAMEQPNPESMDYMLATINAGGYISRDNPSIAIFKTLLQQLDTKFVEDEKQIGDMSVATWKMLRNKGIGESLLNIMEGINELFSEKQVNLKYAEYASIYFGLRIKGHSHNEAVKRFKMLLQSRGIH